MNLKLLVVAMLSVLGLAGCGGDDHDDNDGGDSPAKILKAVEFTETPAPSTLDEMAKTYSKSTVKLSYTNGSVVEKPLSYTTLFSVKDKISEVKGQRHPAGQLYNYKMEALLDPMGNPVVAGTSGTPTACSTSVTGCLVASYRIRLAVERWLGRFFHPRLVYPLADVDDLE